MYCPKACTLSLALLGGKSLFSLTLSESHGQFWNSSFFEKTTLKNLGLCIQLGHLPGQTCSSPKCSFNDNFTIMDTHGIHSVTVDYCNCENAKSPVQQLSQVQWFPATTINPCSATMFRLLQEFQLLSFESKVSAHEFYQSLACNSDNNNINNIKVVSFYLS